MPYKAWEIVVLADMIGTSGVCNHIDPLIYSDTNYLT